MLMTGYKQTDRTIIALFRYQRIQQQDSFLENLFLQGVRMKHDVRSISFNTTAYIQNLNKYKNPYKDEATKFDRKLKKMK